MADFTVPIVDSENTRTVSDDDFEGVSGNKLPDDNVALDFTCKSATSTKPSVVVDVSQGTDGNGNTRWIRIPVTEATMWENKDGEAAITRTSRIHFPMEWGSVSILQFIDGFLTQNELASQEQKYDECRVWFYDNNVENDDVEPRYVLKQYGYVGGMGPTGNGEGRFWVYDPAKLLAGIAAGEQWTEPTYQEIIGYVVDRLEEQSVFDNIQTTELTYQTLPDTKSEAFEFETNFDEGIEIPFTGVSILTGFGNVIEDLINAVIPFNKTFKSNRHNLVDVMKWYSDRVDARWWFEPRSDGPVLVTDSIDLDAGDEKFNRRYFADQDSTDKIINAIPDNETVFTDVDILNNTAIVDMKPFNTVKVFGESQQSAVRAANPESTGPTSASPFTEQYPYAKFRYEPLYERADQHEYLPNPIESDKTTIDGVVAEAKKQLRKHLAEATEGSVELRGEPHLEPYDYLVSVPVCENTFPNTEATPMTWEINAIKHEHGGNKQYTCELGVSIAVKDDKLNKIKSEYKTATETNDTS